jgi:hypothetical protein
VAVAVECRSCGRRFRAKDRHRGRQTNCPGCGQSLVVEGGRVPDHDVFISYSSKDKPAADAVCAALEAERLRCWIAPRDILPGAEWGSAIVDAIQESPVFVLVYTANSNRSGQVLREVERAVSKGAAIIPMRIEDVPPTRAMEYFISASHWLDAVGGPLEAHVQQLVRTVAALLKQREAPAESGDEKPAATLPPPDFSLPTPPLRAGLARYRKWGLALASAAVALAVVAGVLWRTHDRPGNGATATDARQPGAPAASPINSPAPPADGPGTVDLLALIQPDRDRASGVWMRGDAGLAALSRGRGTAGLVLPYVPPEVYDFRLEFTGPSGEGAVVQVCSAGGQSFAWIVKQRRAGFSSLRGRPFSKNSVPLRGAAIPGGRSVSLVQVRKGTVRAYVNGVLIAEAPPGDLRTARPGGRHWNLGLAADGTPATFHAIEVVEVSGKGNVLRDRPATRPEGADDFAAEGAEN